MKIVIISGLSGSGKTVALHALEDADFYCMDNIPISLLPALVDNLLQRHKPLYDKIAVGVDARSSVDDIRRFPEYLIMLRNLGESVDLHLVFFDASDAVLIKRFSETRRKHPLSSQGLPLADAIKSERALLSVIKENADLIIDTTRKHVHELRQLVNDRLGGGSRDISLLFQSFGYKHGIPADSDFVFDVRCIPNPYWAPELRPYTGKDPEVVQFLQAQPLSDEILQSIGTYLQHWLPEFQKENRRYLTVSIGCTGGQHRSVYICEQLAGIFRNRFENVSIRHRELA